MKRIIAALVCTLAVGSLFYATAVHAEGPFPKKDANTSPIVNSYSADTMRVQGEQRYRANCSRCHAAPQKFPPRMMATVLRHMRVRATITDEDMRLVLFYMSQ